ncbi:MAG: HAD-IA family hydrolase [Candidatus Hodarchaeota archaeon]
MRDFKYIIWDFDGTLFDSYPHIASVIVEIMKNNYNTGLNLKEVQEWCELSLAFCFNKITSEFKISLSEFELLFKNKYEESTESQESPFPRAEEILKYIQENGGKNYIITHRRKKTLSKLLCYYGMEEYFDAKITTEDGFPNKPDPTSFLYIINQNKMTLEKVLAIGDRDIDIQAARSINVKSCYFNPRGKTHGLADYNIKNLIDLKKIL